MVGLICVHGEFWPWRQKAQVSLLWVNFLHLSLDSNSGEEKWSWRLSSLDCSQETVSLDKCPVQVRWVVVSLHGH